MDPLAAQFHANPSVNPITKRKIKVGGPKWLELAAKYGRPENCEVPKFIVPSRDRPPHSRANFLTTDGRVIVGSYPQHTDSGLTPNSLAEYGVTTIVNLTPKRYIAPLHIINFPIANGKASPKMATIELIDKLVILYNQGHVIYIHCMGGHGRAGMIGALLLGSLCKLDGVEAINIVERCRETRADTSRNFVPTPETNAQVQLILFILGDGGKPHPDRSDRSWLKRKG